MSVYEASSPTRKNKHTKIVITVSLRSQKRSSKEFKIIPIKYLLYYLNSILRSAWK